MASEYRLSYTAADIDARLGKIDSLAEKAELPTKTSELTNDSGFVTETYVTEYAQQKGDYALQSEIPTVPTNVSAFNNDAGYLTEHQSLDGFATETYVDEQIAAIPAQVQADWSQNDSTADSYVKNRTHWEDAPQEVEILAETTVEFDMEESQYVDMPILNLAANQEYIVSWNGVQYNCTAYYSSDGGVAIGNGDLFLFGDNSGDGNGEPFFYASYDDFAAIFMAESGNYTMSITTIQSVVHQLDPKYIKDMYYEYMAPNNDLIIDEQDFSTDGDYVWVDVNIDSFLTEGATYIVTWNDQTYTCTARYDSWGDIYIGNQAIGVEGDGYEFPETIESNEPFFFYTYQDDYEDFWGLCVQTAGEYTISVVGTGEKLVPYKIDIKYMPDKIVETFDMQWNEMENMRNEINNAYNLAATAQTTANTAKTNAATAQSAADTNSEKLLTLGKKDITIPVTKGCKHLVYGNGKFVAFDYSTDIAAYSEDGITWTQTQLPSVNTALTYGNGKFVAIKTNSDIAVYSEDGITWTQTQLPSSNYWYHLTYGNGKFVATTQRDNIAVYSEDGITWMQTQIPNANYCKCLTYGNGKFVAVFEDGIAAYSEDGITWIQTQIQCSAANVFLTYGNGKFVAISGDNLTDNDIVSYSEDGITWTQTQLPSITYWQSLTYGNGKFVAISDKDGIAAYSEDGITWIQTQLPIPANTDLRCLTYGNGKFIMVVHNSNVAIYSEDGITWTQTQLPSSKGWYASTYGNGKFIIVAYNSNACVYSRDGITWSNTYDILTQGNEDITDKVKDLILPISSTAQVGQLLAVKAVDENGKPTEWGLVTISLTTDENGVMGITMT